MLEFNMIDASTTIEIDILGQYTDIIFNDGESKLKITFSQDNVEYLKQKLSPDGLIPDSFEGQINIMNQLIEELEDIIDKNDPDYELKKVYYDEEIGEVYFDCREIEI